MTQLERTVLIVDDEPILREIMEFEVAEMGFKSISAQNGREALALVKVQRVDAVISDIRMPGGDGVELLDAIKAHNVKAPIVLLMSGFSDLTLEDAYDKGAMAIFSKPIDLVALRAMLSAALSVDGSRWAQDANLQDVSGRVELSFDKDMAPSSGRIVSLGRGGMFIQLESDLPLRFNDLVGFKVTFKDDSLPSLDGTGAVRWIRSTEHKSLPHGMGIEFKFLSDSCRQLVSAIIDRSETRAYIPKK